MLYVISIILAIIIALCRDGEIIVLKVVLASMIDMAFISTMYFCYGNGISKSIVENTIKKKAVSNNFVNYAKFSGVGATILVDERTGRIAYISSRNPFAFQVVSAKEIHNIISTYDKGSFEEDDMYTLSSIIRICRLKFLHLHPDIWQS